MLNVCASVQRGHKIPGWPGQLRLQLLSRLKVWFDGMSVKLKGCVRAQGAMDVSQLPGPLKVSLEGSCFEVKGCMMCTEGTGPIAVIAGLAAVVASLVPIAGPLLEVRSPNVLVCFYYVVGAAASLRTMFSRSWSGGTWNVKRLSIMS